MHAEQNIAPIHATVTVEIHVTQQESKNDDNADIIVQPLLAAKVFQSVPLFGRGVVLHATKNMA